VVVSVVFFTVVPPPPGAPGVVVVFVSTVVVVSLVVLPSLVCDVFISVLFSVVRFWFSHPRVSRPIRAIKTDLKKSFTCISFRKKAPARRCQWHESVNGRQARNLSQSPPMQSSFLVFRYPRKLLALNPPPKNDNTARIRNTTKRIFATPTKEPAIPPKPRTAAIKAMTRQAMASCNMFKLS
jgi:hypothetical protein